MLCIYTVASYCDCNEIQRRRPSGVTLDHSNITETERSTELLKESYLNLNLTKN